MEQWGQAGLRQSLVKVVGLFGAERVSRVSWAKSVPSDVSAHRFFWVF